MTMLLPFIPTAKAEQPGSIKDQIRAYANTIKRSDSADDAATELAYHGIRGGGKKLTMSSTGAMASTILNSEVFQDGLAILLEDLLESVQRLDMQNVPDVHLDFCWYGADSRYTGDILTGANEYPDNLDWKFSAHGHSGSLNSNDNALEWMVGNCRATTVIDCIKDSGTQKTYKLTMNFEDRFDFDTANTGGFKKLLSAVGMKLFKEFDWGFTVTMEIVAPYSYESCSHGSGAYHWTYDSTNLTMISDGSGEYIQNNASHHSFTSQNGKIQDYYELDKTIRLYHNKPWVLEYDVQKPDIILFSPIKNTVTKTHPLIIQRGRDTIFVSSRNYYNDETSSTDTSDSIYSYDYCGTALYSLYRFVYTYTYTMRLENELLPDGGNQIYLTAIELETGNTVIDRLPMDDQYQGIGWGGKISMTSEENNLFSGKDILINYIGNKVGGLCEGVQDIRIWENGKDGGSGTYWEETTVAPTCTTDGYTIRKCSCCGLTERINGGAALGHRYGEWTQVLAPGCGAAGKMERKCTGCGDTQQQEVAALIHEYGEYVSDGNATCTQDGTASASCIHCGTKITQEAPGSALGHSMSSWVTRVAPTCKTAGEEHRACTRCDYGESRELPALGHDHKAVVTAATCIDQGFTTHTCANCGDSYIDGYTDPQGHTWKNANAIHLECIRCDYEEGGFPVTLTMPEMDRPIPGEIWADGVSLPLEQKDGQYLVYLPHDQVTNLVLCTTNETATEDVHTQYPDSMKVWMLNYQDGAYTATYVPEFDDLLTYAGCSIRITGVKGIRMITSVNKDTKNALTGAGLAGYTLAEYGTALAWAADLENGLVLGQEYTKSNFAYKKGEADPVYAQTDDAVQYTNVLVGFDDDQCIPDIAMRPYIILEDAEGNEITIYGGTIYRSIGYIAWQNRDAFKPGSASYEYVWGIIHHVYGDRFDEEYQK